MQFQRCGGAGQRSSVALPIGINGRTASFNASLYPKTGHPTFFNLTLAAGRPGGIAIFDAERRVAGLPWGGVRPARPVGSQEHGPFVLSKTTVRRQRRAATSADELQPAASRGGELRGSVSRKSTANKFSLIA